MVIILLTASALFLQSLLVIQPQARTRLIFDGEYGGCQNIFVYRATDDQTKALLVDINSERLKLSRKRKAYQIGSTPGLEVLIEDYGKYKHNEYCSDFVQYPQKARRIYAVAGTVTVFISKHLKRHRFVVTVRLKDVSVPKSDGSSYYVESTEMKNVVVGYLP